MMDDIYAKYERERQPERNETLKDALSALKELFSCAFGAGILMTLILIMGWWFIPFLILLAALNRDKQV